MGKADRAATARERIAAQREAARKQDQRRRLVTILTVAVVAVLAVGGVAWYSASQSAPEQASTAALPPITLNNDGSVTMAKAGVTSPVLDVYEDFQCPVCKEMEKTTGQTIKNLAIEGKVKVVYHPITIFQQDPAKSNSLRAGAAAKCITDGKQWMAYHDKLYAEQPDETKAGFELNDLVAWGHDVGVTASGFDSCVTGQRNIQPQTDYSAQVITSQNIQGTPTVKLNGADVANETVFVPSKLRQAVLDAGK